MSEEFRYPTRDNIPMPPRRGKGRGEYPDEATLINAGEKLVRHHGLSARAAAKAVLNGHERIGSSPEADIKRLSLKINLRMKSKLK